MFIYIKVLIFLLVLFWSGITIVRRATSDNRAQIIIPAGTIIGIAIYIFLINLFAHFLKGPPGIIVALITEISIAIVIKRFKSIPKLEFPKGGQMALWITSLIIWSLFLYVITAHAQSNGGDSVNHYSIASLFIRGDYPPHTPFQPDYLMYYHLGAGEFLGAVKALTGAPYYFTHSLISFFALLAMSQIFTWLIPVKKSYFSLLIISLPALIGIISMGNFMAAWPVQIGLPDLAKGPTIYNAQEVYGTPHGLDILIYFIHRLLSTSFIIGLLPIIIRPINSRLIISLVLLTVFSATALTDEVVLFVTLPAYLLILFLTVFKKALMKWVLFITLTGLVIILQGGIITETIIGFNNGESGVIIFPRSKQESDRQNNSYRLRQQSSKMIPDQPQYFPLKWFHPGIFWSLSVLLLIIIYVHRTKNSNQQIRILLSFLFVSAVTAVVAYHEIVPKDYLSANGNRFLALSYYLSGLGITFFILFWWLNSSSKKYIIPKIFICWIFAISIIPSFALLFPRPKDFWYKISPKTERPAFEWVKNNLPVRERVLALTDPDPIPFSNLIFVTEIGALTPLWAPEPRVYDIFDMGPTYADLYYTLNPDSLKILKVKYLIINNLYLTGLTDQRKADVLNSEYFQPRFFSQDRTEGVFEVTDRYLYEAKNLAGTLEELVKVAPKTGTFFIDYRTSIPEHMFRALRLILNDREVYHVPTAAFYNGRIGINYFLRKDLPGNYDYLILGGNADPRTFCNCDTELLWTGLGSGIKLWRTL